MVPLDAEDTSVDPRVWSGDLAARLRGLLHASPLIEMRARDRQADDAFKHYDSLALAVRLVDLVLASTGMEDELDHDGAVAALTPLLTAMDHAAGVTPNGERHEAAARRVLAMLLNDERRREPFERPYIAPGGSAGVVERHVSFGLLSDYHAVGPEGGRIVLRPSAVLINLMLRALPLDLADQQQASEALVQAQLARGRFEDALQSARAARLQSIHYTRALDDQMERTRRDVRRVDWAEEVPRMLAEAHELLKLRLATEENIREAAEQKLDDLAPGSEGALQVAAVAELMRDCHHRHTELHARLMRARAVFLDAQGRQAFAPARALIRPDITHAMLEPMLRASAARVRPAADAALRLLRPAAAPGLLLLSQTILWQLKPRRETPPGAVALHVIDPESVSQDAHTFPAEVRAEALGILRMTEPGASLSSVLRRATAEGRRAAVSSALTLYVLRAFAPDVASRAGSTDDPLTHEAPADFEADDEVGTLIGVRIERLPGSRLEAPGYAGDDLRITPSAPAAAAGTPTGGIAADTTASRPIASPLRSPTQLTKSRSQRS